MTSSEIPGGWERHKLGDLCTFRAGAAFKQALQGRDHGDYPFIKVSDMAGSGNEHRIAHATHWVAEDDLAVIKSKPFESGTVVFAKIGEGLKANRFRVLTRPTLIDNNMMGATAATGRLEPAFLPYFLRSLRLPDLAAGTALPYLKATDLAALPVSAPPLEEQRAIAWILQSLDAKIESNRRLAASCEAAADRLFRATFIDFVGKPLIESQQLGLIPDGWRAVSLSEAIALNPRVGIKKGTEIPFVEMAALPKFGTRPDGVGRRVYSGGARFERGDTLFARITPCTEHGKGAFIDFLDGPAAGSTEFIVMRAKAPLTPEAVFLLSRTDRVRAHAIQNMGGTSGRQRVPVECFNDIYVALPPSRDEWAPVAESLKVLFARSLSLWRESAHLREIRDVLLPKLVSGQVRVRDMTEPGARIAPSVEGVAG